MTAIENQEFVRCIRCGSFVDYEDAHVHEHSVDENDMLEEHCICKWCKEGEDQ